MSDEHWQSPDEVIEWLMTISYLESECDRLKARVAELEAERQGMYAERQAIRALVPLGDEWDSRTLPEAVGVAVEQAKREALARLEKAEAQSECAPGEGVPLLVPPMSEERER